VVDLHKKWVDWNKQWNDVKLTATQVKQQALHDLNEEWTKKKETVVHKIQIMGDGFAPNATESQVKDALNVAKDCLGKTQKIQEYIATYKASKLPPPQEQLFSNGKSALQELLWDMDTLKKGSILGNAQKAIDTKYDMMACHNIMEAARI